MNERIKELANEAFAKSIHPGELDLERFSEKLAELIVKECLDQCYNNGMNDELYAGQLKAAAYIEKHFGVEE
jgi:hypothetical protein